MIYVMSDIHGRIDLFDAMLEKINLQKGDKLYVIGDCIDRGGGLQVLQKIIELHKKNMCDLILGNHEYYFKVNSKYHLDDAEIEEYQREINQRTIHREQEQPEEKYKSETMADALSNLFRSFSKLNNAIENNNRVGELQRKINTSINMSELCSYTTEWETFSDWDRMSKDERSEILDFLSKCVEEKYIKVGDKSYLLVHGGLLKENEKSEQLFVREDFYANPVDKTVLKEKGYAEDTVVVFGHTTTRDINLNKKGIYIAPYKIWYDVENHNDKIGIDCGASFPHGQLACLRLNDMKEYYVTNQQQFITPIEKMNGIFGKFNFGELMKNNEE